MAYDLDLTDVSSADDLEVKEVVSGASDAPTTAPTEIICPLTGEIVDTSDPDQLIDCFERLKEADAQIFDAKRRVQFALAALTEGDAKTRRVRGRRRRAKIEMPDNGWSQSILKEAYHAYPQFRDELLRIDSVGVKAREFKKAVNETGPDDWSTFRNMIASAEQPATATPRVTVEG
jgi:hypothetical protein